MKTKSEHLFGFCQPQGGWAFLDPRRLNLLRRGFAGRGDDDSRAGERGNVLIYVLIAIALFAALSFTLMKQSDDSESGALSDEKAELYATQLITYASQVRSSIDQMLFTASTSIDELDFTTPDDADFNTGTLIHKVYHPQGGGINAASLPDAVVAQVDENPVAGWYLGRFNNVDWTSTTGEDVILAAYQINKKVCELINKKIDNSIATPAVSGPLRRVFIDSDFHSQSNLDFTTGSGDFCPECLNKSSLCVSSNSGNTFVFYTIIADQ